MDIVFAIKKKKAWSASLNEISSLYEKRLKKNQEKNQDKCTQNEKLQCCVAQEWNGLNTEEYNVKKKDCNRIGCKKCPNGFKRPDQ
jgi:hypothetical protein